MTVGCFVLYTQYDVKGNRNVSSHVGIGFEKYVACIKYTHLCILYIILICCHDIGFQWFSTFFLWNLNFCKQSEPI